MAQSVSLFLIDYTFRLLAISHQQENLSFGGGSHLAHKI